MNIKMTHTFTLYEKQIEELKLLQKAINNCKTKNGIPGEYTIEDVFKLIMITGQNQMISERIKNTAYYFSEYYDKKN